MGYRFLSLEDSGADRNIGLSEGCKGLNVTSRYLATLEPQYVKYY